MQETKPSDLGAKDSPQWSAIAPLEVLEHLTDVHCHPTDSPTPHETMSTLPIRVCAMATRDTDQSLVRDLAIAYPDKVVAGFGFHPWFVHWISLDPNISKEDHYKSLFLTPHNPKSALLESFQKLLSYLPNPVPLSDIISQLRENLLAVPSAMVGEIGLDRVVRIPYSHPSPPPYALNDTKKDLSPFTIPLDHQLAIIEAQLDIAAEMKRNVSFHSVKSQQATVDLLDRMKSKHGRTWEMISVDMHSCGLSAQTWKDIERKHSNVFLSLSTAINTRSPQHRDLITSCSPNRILVESDFHDIHDSIPRTWDMLKIVAELKGWTIECDWNYTDADVNVGGWGAVKRIEENWKAFQRGGHSPIRKKRDKRQLLLSDSETDGEGYPN